MEDKRTALAILLCIIVVVVYSELVFAPYKQSHTPARAPVEQISTESNSTLQKPVNSQATDLTSTTPTQAVTTSSQAGTPRPAEITSAGSSNIRSTLYQAELSNLGGRLSSFKLFNYKRHLNQPELVDLVSAIDGQPLPLGVYVGGISDAFVKYKLDGYTSGTSTDGKIFSVPTSGELALSLVGTLPNGIAIKKIIKFQPNSYLLEVEILLGQAASDGSKLWFEWTHFLTDTEAELQFNPKQFSLLTESNKIEHHFAPSLQDGLGDTVAVDWIAFSDKYFMAALIPQENGPNARMGRAGKFFYDRISGTTTQGSFTIYVGPKDPSILQKLEYDLTRSIDLGWFTFLAYPLLSLIRLFYNLLGNYGLAIIVLTLLIKAAFLPLTKASFKSMQSMQDLQPEMKALRERVKDPTQLNQEMLALYKRRGVNPMGGCFPILIQLPVFLGLYNALNNAIELRHAPFALWITDLSSPEHLDVFGIPIPVMVLLMGLSMFVQQWTTPSTLDPVQKRVMNMMPIIMTATFVIFPFPAGLVLYWLVNNIISIIQQVYLRTDRKASPMQATLIASVAIFFIGYIVTLF